MASGRVTRSGRKIPIYGQQPRSKSTEPYPTTSMDIDQQENSPKQPNQNYTTNLESKDFFNSEDEVSSSGNQTSGSERSIDEQKTPKPAKKAKKNTPTNLQKKSPKETIKDL